MLLGIDVRLSFDRYLFIRTQIEIGHKNGHNGRRNFGRQAAPGRVETPNLRSLLQDGGRNVVNVVNVANVAILPTLCTIYSRARHVG